MKKGAVFRQSVSDFPLTVKLGEKMPSWGLSRWGGNRGLRFVPPDGEGFSLRGDKRRLVYKGRRRSHRFTILGDSAFEYDCILEREPDSNVIALRMDGAENFDFYKQPYSAKDPFVRGSFAVYKKETLAGEGTGKLCHIHRPEIIDARGRRCWGDLSVVGNELRITIPEKWLCEAKYPVVVDPTVGTNQIGSQTTGQDPPYYFFDRPALDNNLALSRYFIDKKPDALCTAYVYCYWENNWTYLIPALYTDNNNQPDARKSKNELDIYVKVSGIDQPGWRGGLFELNSPIAAGSYIWFGVRARLFATKFDSTPIGDECLKFYSGYNTELPSEVDPNDAIAKLRMRFSWYFSYTLAPPGENYVCKLVAGVSLTDRHTEKAGYQRKKIEVLNVADSRKAEFNFSRVLSEIAGINFLLGRFRVLYRNIKETVTGADKNAAPILFFRSLRETLEPKDTNSRFGAYYRGIFDNIQTDSEAKAGKIQFTKIADTVQAAGAVLRGLVMRVRIVTGAFVRDYLLGRFLKARSELELKSVITREIILECKIH